MNSAEPPLWFICRFGGLGERVLKAAAGKPAGLSLPNLSAMGKRGGGLGRGRGGRGGMEGGGARGGDEGHGEGGEGGVGGGEVVVEGRGVGEAVGGAGGGGGDEEGSPEKRERRARVEAIATGASVILPLSFHFCLFI